jgi:hypothetical protein
VSVGSTELTKRAEVPALPALERELSVGSTELTKRAEVPALPALERGL